MSHHTYYGVKHLLLYAATFNFTRDDLSESVLRRNIGDKGGLDLVNPDIRLTMLNLELARGMWDRRWYAPKLQEALKITKGRGKTTRVATTTTITTNKTEGKKLLDLMLLPQLKEGVMLETYHCVIDASCIISASAQLSKGNAKG
nr:hypothetical protein [Tanacetum cinerariifolium]